MQMHNEPYILLIAIIAVLVVLVVVLLCYILYNQGKLNDKNEAIIREIRENIHLRDELQRRLASWATFAVLASSFVSQLPTTS